MALPTLLFLFCGVHRDIPAIVEQGYVVSVIKQIFDILRVLKCPKI